MTNIVNLPTYEQAEAIKRMVEETSGVVIDTNGAKYRPVMTKNDILVGLYDKIKLNKPPISSRVAIVYDKENNCIYYANTRTIGKVNISTTSHEWNELSLQDVPYAFQNSYKNRMENVIQMYGDYLYVYSTRRNTTISESHHAIYCINKHTLQLEKTYDLKTLFNEAYGNTTGVMYYNIDGILITEKHIIINAEHSINNTYYPPRMFVINKNSGEKTARVILDKLANRFIYIKCIYQIGNYIYTLAGDGATLFINKLIYNDDIGSLSVAAVNTAPLDLGANNPLNAYYMFHEGDTLYIGERLTAVNIETLSIVIPTIPSIRIPLGKRGNNLYCINSAYNGVVAYDINTQSVLQVANFEGTIDTLISRYNDFSLDKAFSLSDFIFGAGAGPSKVKVAYSIQYYEFVNGGN